MLFDAYSEHSHSPIVYNHYYFDMHGNRIGDGKTNKTAPTSQLNNIQQQQQRHHAGIETEKRQLYFFSKKRSFELPNCQFSDGDNINEEEVDNRTKDEEDDDDDDNHELSCDWIESDDDDDDDEYEYVAPSDDDDDGDYTFGLKNQKYYFSTRSDDDDTEDDELASPFWFANEDREQMQVIFHVYNQFLIKEKSRSLQLFVGQISRFEATFGNEFQTFDIVDIFNQQLKDETPEVPFDHTVHLLTTWDREEGLPITLHLLDEDRINFWKNRVQRKLSKPSYLHCEPHFYARNEYVYSISQSSKKIFYQFDYNNLSATQKISW